ncbi:MAG: hypothetical protein ACXW30_03270 [Micavibrio sp.]
MKKQFNASSSPEFVARLSSVERAVYDAFTKHQIKPENATFCVFQGYWRVVTTATVLSGKDSRLADFLTQSKKDDPESHRHLLMALNLRRSFESQWPVKAGRLNTLEGFVNDPLIRVPGLPNSPHNKLTLVQDTKEPAQRPTMYRTPRLSLIQGGFTP